MEEFDYKIDLRISKVLRRGIVISWCIPSEDVKIGHVFFSNYWSVKITKWKIIRVIMRQNDLYYVKAKLLRVYNLKVGKKKEVK